MKLIEVMILKQKELSREIIVHDGWNINQIGCKARDRKHVQLKLKVPNKVAIWQSQRTMNLFNNATSLWVHCELNVFIKFAIRILKLRVLSGLPKMVSFKCEAKMPRHNDEESFINKISKIEMKKMVGLMENLPERFKTLLYLIMN